MLFSSFLGGGESLPLAPKQVAPRNVSASRAVSLRFVACPLPLLTGALRPRNDPGNLRIILIIQKLELQNDALFQYSIGLEMCDHQFDLP